MSSRTALLCLLLIAALLAGMARAHAGTAVADPAAQHQHCGQDDGPAQVPVEHPHDCGGGFCGCGCVFPAGSLPALPRLPIAAGAHAAPPDPAPGVAPAGRQRLHWRPPIA